MSNELAATSISNGRVALTKGGSLKDIREAIKFHPEVKVNLPEVEPVERVELTHEAKDALKNLPEVFNSVDPSVARVLTDEELEDIYEERNTIRALEDELKNRQERIKEILRVHTDRVAEGRGDADESTPKDARGHYIVSGPGNPYRVPIGDTQFDVSQEYRSGQVSVNDEALEELAESDRPTYLALTRARRVFDEEKALEFLQKNPDGLEVFAKVTKRGMPHTALFFRKKRTKK